MKIPSQIKNYFVDESGSPEIFNKKGQVIVGTEGCSRFFMLGFLDIPDPKEVRDSLRDLQKKLITDPYFHNVPSMQPEENKTAKMFHAKDDLPEVRWKVYELLRSFEGLKFVAVVKDKHKVIQYALERRKSDPNYKYNPNELYDHLTRRLFKNHLHLASKYKVIYSIRGNKPRTDAFGSCLQVAQERFMRVHKIGQSSVLELYPTQSKSDPCLQATDYFLWALFRLYEKQEDRYFNFIRDMFSLVVDIDDTRNRNYGEYYDNHRNILSLEKMRGRG